MEVRRDYLSMRRADFTIAESRRLITEDTKHRGDTNALVTFSYKVLSLAPAVVPTAFLQDYSATTTIGSDPDATDAQAISARPSDHSLSVSDGNTLVISGALTIVLIMPLDEKSMPSQELHARTCPKGMRGKKVTT